MRVQACHTDCVTCRPMSRGLLMSTRRTIGVKSSESSWRGASPGRA